ncbi:MAG: hypothetical protein WA347_07890 [Rhabdochlamydiaceae bacterium]|jgi:hypothetical protein
MVSKVIDLTQNWVIHFDSLVKNEIPLKMEEKDGVISFFVPFDRHRGITVELMTLKEEEQIVEGKYTANPFSYKEEVVFKILKVGKLLGKPKGSMSRDVWMISSIPK